MKVWTLLENEALDGRFAAANGLSLWIESAGRRILFDFGPDGSFAANAEALGLSIADADAAALSHGHVDHGGGLGRFLELNPTAPVYLRRGAFDPHCRRLGLRMVDVGIQPLESGRLVFFEDSVEVAPGAWLCAVTRRTGYSPPANRMSFTRRGGSLVRDDFSHEALLAVEEAGALYLFTGCSHSGVLSMMEEAARRAPGLPIAAVLGGMHLFHSPLAPLRFARDMDRLGRDLARHAGTRYYTGHCSVEDGLGRLRARLGGRVERIRSGSVLEL